MRNYIFLFLLSFIHIFFNGNIVEAHSIGRSSSYWAVDAGTTEVRWVLSEREFEGLSNNDDYASMQEADLASFLDKMIIVNPVDRGCDIINPKTQPLSGGDVSIEFRLECVPASVSLNGLFTENLRHVHLAHIMGTKDQAFDVLVTSDRDTFNVTAGTEKSDFLSNATDYIKLGFLHILEGFDHLAFLIALLLVVRELKSLFWVVSGFTLGHSITLILGSLNILAATPEIIEPLIAFSIAFTAWDAIISKSNQPHKPLFVGIISALVLFVIDRNINSQIPLIAWIGVLMLSGGVWMFALQGEEKSKRILPVVTIGFGLIHGFGFAGVLADIGLPVDGKFTALLGFNIGVELGQLVFVSAMLLLASVSLFLSKTTSGLVRLLVSYGVILLGLYWFAERVFFG